MIACNQSKYLITFRFGLSSKEPSLNLLAKKGPIVTLAIIALLIFAQGGHATNLAREHYDLSYSTYSDDDVSFSGPVFSMRKHLKEDTSSLKLKLQATNVEDSATDILVTAQPYSETHTSIAGGYDYSYFDTVMSVSSSYATKDTTAFGDLNIDITQFMNNKARALVMGFSYGLVDDADESYSSSWQSFRLGTKRFITSNWAALIQYQYQVKEGDLENDFNMRRYGLRANIDLPETKSESTMLFNLLSKNFDISFKWGNNGWGQQSNRLSVVHMRQFSERFNYQFFAEYFTQKESRYFARVPTLTLAPDVFQSDDRKLAKLTTKEFGAMAQWDYSRILNKSKMKTLKLNLKFASIGNKYANENGISNSGLLLQFGVSGKY